MPLPKQNRFEFFGGQIFTLVRCQVMVGKRFIPKVAEAAYDLDFS